MPQPHAIMGAMSELLRDGDREMNLRYAGSCVSCGETIPRGARAVYNREAKNVRHLTCGANTGSRGVEHGEAGRSAAREGERRLANERARRERDIARSKANIEAVLGTGFLGKVATFLAVDESPHRPSQSTKAWESGAIGEQRVGAQLDALAEVGVITLHDRRIPGSRANIDHIAVTPWGVWVIDSKRYKDKRIGFDIVDSFLGIGGRKRLLVGGRDRTNLVDGVENQVVAVTAVLPPTIDVRGCLCFVEGDWPLIAADFTVRDIYVCWPRKLPRTLLKKQEPIIDPVGVAEQLARAFPPA